MYFMDSDFVNNKVVYIEFEYWVFFLSVMIYLYGMVSLLWLIF